MKLQSLETHVYAPELNTAVFAHNDILYRFRVPGVIRMSDVRRKLFGFERGLLATVTKVYPDMPQLNRSASGFVCSRAEAMSVARDWIKRLAPGGKVTVTVTMRG
jgi:hypothetical protein